MMDPELFDPAVIDGLLALGDPAFLDELLALFVEDLDSRLPRLREAVAAGDLVTIGSDAHALKGAAGNIGARRVADAATALEQQARAQDPAALVETWAAFERTIQATRAAIAAR